MVSLIFEVQELLLFPAIDILDFWLLRPALETEDLRRPSQLLDEEEVLVGRLLLLSMVTDLIILIQYI